MSFARRINVNPRWFLALFFAVSACAVAAEPTRTPLDAGPGGWGGTGGQGVVGVGGHAGGGEAGSAGKGGSAQSGSGGSAQSGSGGSAQSGSGGSAQSGSGGNPGGCGTPGTTRAVGACEKCGELQQTCMADGSWRDDGCQNQKECNPNETKNEDCGNCGTQKYKCSTQCEWVKDGDCSSQGDCHPGDTSACLCDKNHEHCGGTKTCTNQCDWLSCQPDSGGSCAWNGGHTWRCCGKGKWEWCLSDNKWSGNCVSEDGLSCDY